MKFLSWTFVIVFTIGGGVPALLHTIPRSYRMSELGCVRWPEGSDSFVANHMTAVTLVVTQLILLALFCYPLRLHNLKRNKTKKEASSSAKKACSNNNSTEERVIRAMRKAMVSTAVCVISDVFTLFMITVVIKRAPLHLSRSAYDLNLTVKSMSVLFCFDGWRKIVFPPWLPCRPREPVSDRVTS